MRRKIARHWRRLQRQQRPQPSGSSGNLPGVLASLSAPEAGPASLAQFNDAVQKLCRTLDDQDRRVIELRLQGHSTAEVARLLGLDADVLRVRLSRLRKRLHEENMLTEWL